jgi:hypothetical protein
MPSGLSRDAKRAASRKSNASTRVKHKRAEELVKGAGVAREQAEAQVGLDRVTQQRNRDSTTRHWQKLRDNSDALAEFRLLQQTGVDQFHADPERHSAWADACHQHWERLRADPVRYQQWMDSYMEATWRCNDWLLRRTNTWYKVINEEE